MLRRTWRLLFVLAAFLLVWSGAIAPWTAEPAPSLRVELGSRDLGQWPVGESSITCRLTNTGPEASEVMNLGAGCGVNCCFRAKQSGRWVIGPGETTEVEVELLVKKPGPFKVEFDLFFVDCGTRANTVAITGVGHLSKR